jgi:hypothetical protein
MKAWVAFCLTFAFPVLLWGAEGVYPTENEVGAAEWKLLLFGTWLYRAEYASSTVTGYIGAVKKWHHTVVGLPARALGVVFFRLPVLIRVIKKLRPAKQREKLPWEFEFSLAIVAGWRTATGRLCFALSPRRQMTEYQLAVTWEVIKLAFEQLMRLAELVTTNPPSVSMRNPLKWNDVKFFDVCGNQLGYDGSGRPVGVPVRATLREPPSKTRGGGGVLMLPFPTGWQHDLSCLASGPGLFRFQRCYPVPRTQASAIPLFGMSEFDARRPFVVPISQQTFVTRMHALCRGALPVVRYEGLGIHAYRVGGCNRLIDLGASAPQVCAAGRWLGDCWTLYARRQRAVLDELTLAMTKK